MFQNIKATIGMNILVLTLVFVAGPAANATTIPASETVRHVWRLEENRLAASNGSGGIDTGLILFLRDDPKIGGVTFDADKIAVGFAIDYGRLVYNATRGITSLIIKGTTAYLPGRSDDVDDSTSSVKSVLDGNEYELRFFYRENQEVQGKKGQMIRVEDDSPRNNGTLTFTSGALAGVTLDLRDESSSSLGYSFLFAHSSPNPFNTGFGWFDVIGHSDWDGDFNFRGTFLRTIKPSPDPQPIPEPATAGLLGLSLLVGSKLRRSKREKT